MSGSARTSPRGPFAEAALATLVLSILGLMVVPLPLPVLDALLSVELALSALLLLLAVLSRGAAALGAFPVLLLLVTLLRLALDVAATRQILSRGDGGELIRAFGRFVVGGNYVVGAVLFAILTVVQLLVLSRGAERVAEVAARFALDAMPGKQMAIDAELRAGALTQEQARSRRAAVAREAQFFGAMDGAMKFVKGDAIAGLVITFVNVLGGLAVGVGLRGLSGGAALRAYGLLSIGQGLVSQVPAVLVATAAGILVTRVESEHAEDALGTAIARQLFATPAPFAVSSAVLALLALTPGLPRAPFALLALGALALSLRLRRASSRAAALDVESPGAPAPKREGPENSPTEPLQELELLLEPGLRALLEPAGGEEPTLGAEVTSLREELFRSLGVALPTVRVRVEGPAEGRAFRLRCFELPSLRRELPADRLFALHFTGGPTEDQLPDTDPLTGALGGWFLGEHRAALEARGARVFTHEGYLRRALEAVARRHLFRFVGTAETQRLLDALEATYPALLRAVTPRPFSVPQLTVLLRALVEEGVPVRDLRALFEALASASPPRAPDALLNLARQALQESHARALAPEGHARVWLLSPELTDALRSVLRASDTEAHLALTPEQAQDLASAFASQLEQGESLLLVDPELRRPLWRLLAPALPSLRVLTETDLPPRLTVEVLGALEF